MKRRDLNQDRGSGALTELGDAGKISRTLDNFVERISQAQRLDNRFGHRDNEDTLALFEFLQRQGYLTFHVRHRSFVQA